MLTKTDISIEEARIRRLFEEWTKAVVEKNVESLMAYYSPDVVVFDLIPPMEYRGLEAYRKSWQTGFECMPGNIEFETHDMQLTVDEETAFCHRLVRMSGTSKDGESCGCWMRWTVCLRKIDGNWRITHEHVSVPCNPENNQALMDLGPQP